MSETSVRDQRNIPTSCSVSVIGATIVSAWVRECFLITVVLAACDQGGIFNENYDKI